MTTEANEKYLNEVYSPSNRTARSHNSHAGQCSRPRTCFSDGNLTADVTGVKHAGVGWATTKLNLTQ